MVHVFETMMLNFMTQCQIPFVIWQLIWMNFLNVSVTDRPFGDTTAIWILSLQIAIIGYLWGKQILICPWASHNSYLKPEHSKWLPHRWKRSISWWSHRVCACAKVLMTTVFPPPVGPTIIVVWRVNMVSYIWTTLSACHAITQGWDNVTNSSCHKMYYYQK